MSRRIRLPRAVPVLFLVGGFAGVGAPQQPTSPSAVSAERAVLDRYCLGCHNTKVKTAGLALDAIRAAPVDEHSEAWENVVRKLRTRTMPPAGLPRPDERTYDGLVSSLATSL